VSIIPGIENLDPDRTDTSRGFFGSPNLFRATLSRRARCAAISRLASGGIFPLFL
jgi:hypothetical protein